MKKFDKKSARLFELAHKFNDGLLSDEEGAELNEILRDDEDAQLVFLEARDQQLELEERFSGTRLDERPLSGELSAPPASKPRLRFIGWFAAAAAAIMISFALGSKLAAPAPIAKMAPPAQQEIKNEVFQETLAGIGLSIDVEDPKLAAGNTLSAEEISLEEGFMSLEMSSRRPSSQSRPPRISSSNRVTQSSS